MFFKSIGTHSHLSHQWTSNTKTVFSVSFRFFILYNRCRLLLPKHIESLFFRSKLEYIGIHYSESWWCSWVGVFASAQTAKVPMFPRNASCFWYFWYFFDKSDMHNISLIFFSYTWIFFGESNDQLKLALCISLQCKLQCKRAVHT